MPKHDISICETRVELDGTLEQSCGGDRVDFAAQGLLYPGYKPGGPQARAWLASSNGMSNLLTVLSDSPSFLRSSEECFTEGIQDVALVARLSFRAR